ncbi:MAG: hypothetical protein ACTHMC_26560 [Pseudobacter sp.]|uniref:hypothetical protein n=1 Tax=Pseudobacter sp. TaxID=2045420 RepID=UPI003F7DDBB2
MLKNFKVLPLLAAVVGILSASCSKNNGKEEPAPEPAPEYPTAPVQGELQVHFDASTIELARVDSGYVVLQREGNGLQYLKRFTKGNHLLRIDIDGMAEGQYSASFVIDMKLKNDNKVIWRQFRVKKDLRLVQTGVAVKAPLNELKKEWKPYVVLSDATRSFQLTVPMDCSDPYFEFLRRDPKWDYVHFERAAYKRTGPNSKTPLGAKSFECANGECFDGNGFIIDSKIFEDWSGNISAYPWDNAEIFLILLNEDTGNDLTILHSFDIPDVL